MVPILEPFINYVVVIQHSGRSTEDWCQYRKDSQRQYFLLFRSARAGSQASPQDRFLIMAAEMENAGSQELAQFWKEVPKTKVMEHRSVKYLHILSDVILPGCSGVTSPLLDCFSLRLRCHVLESARPPVSPLRDSPVETPASEQQELSTVVSSGGRT